MVKAVYYDAIEPDVIGDFSDVVVQALASVSVNGDVENVDGENQKVHVDPNLVMVSSN